MVAQTVGAIRATVELIRDLDGAPRHARTARWLTKKAPTGCTRRSGAEREWVVVRQLGAAEDGTITRYWWQRLEDDEGILTDQALDRDEWGLRPLSREDFYTAWDDPGWSLTTLTA